MDTSIAAHPLVIAEEVVAAVHMTCATLAGTVKQLGFVTPHGVVLLSGGVVSDN